MVLFKCNTNQGGWGYVIRDIGQELLFKQEQVEQNIFWMLSTPKSLPVQQPSTQQARGGWWELSWKRIRWCWGTQSRRINSFHLSAVGGVIHFFLLVTRWLMPHALAAMGCNVISKTRPTRLIVLLVWSFGSQRFSWAVKIKLSVTPKKKVEKMHKFEQCCLYIFHKLLYPLDKYYFLCFTISHCETEEVQIPNLFLVNREKTHLSILLPLSPNIWRW